MRKPFPAKRRRFVATVGLAAVALGLSPTTACKPQGHQLVTLPINRPAGVLIRSVGVFDARTGKTTADRDVLIQKGRIDAITASGGTTPPHGSQIIEGKGRTLIPGLIDMHGHVASGSAPVWLSELPDADANLRSYLYCGVTTVFDPAGLSGEVFPRREAIAAGKTPGPTIFAAGPIFTPTDGHPVPILRSVAPWWIRWYLIPRFARQVDTEQEARSAVAEVDALGADFIKIAVDSIPIGAARMRPEIIAALTAESQRRGLRTVAHIGNTQDALDAGRAGINAWVHNVYKERIPDAHIAEMASFEIPMVPTVEVFSSWARLGEGPREESQLERETVPPATLRGFDTPPRDDARLAFFESWFEMVRAARAHWGENIARLHAAGVTILAGSDVQSGVFPGPALHRELSHLVAAGLSPAEALQAATIYPARFLEDSEDPEYGLVEVGKRADLVLVEGDPTRDIGAVSRIRHVIKNGTVVQRHPRPQG